MAKKKKGQRADGLIEIARKMPDGKTRHFYGHSRAECEDKYQRAELWACPCIAAQSFRAISIQQRIASKLTLYNLDRVWYNKRVKCGDMDRMLLHQKFISSH